MTYTAVNPHVCCNWPSLEDALSQGDDELECLHEGTHALSCHADQGKVGIYRAQIVQSMSNAGDDILACLRLAPTCNVDVAAFALPEFDEGIQTPIFLQEKIKGSIILTLTNFEFVDLRILSTVKIRSKLFFFCSCCEQGAQA